MDLERHSAELGALESRAARERQQAEVNLSLLYDEQEARARSDAERERLSRRVLQLEMDLSQLLRATARAETVPRSSDRTHGPANSAKEVEPFYIIPMELPVNPFAPV